MSATFSILNTGKVYRALTKDIGGKGVCLVMEEELELGTPLAVEMTLPDRQTPVAFVGDVVWSTLLIEASSRLRHPPVETGVRFVSINPKDRTLIMQYTRLNALPSL